MLKEQQEQAEVAEAQIKDFHLKTHAHTDTHWFVFINLLFKICTNKIQVLLIADDMHYQCS